MPPIAANGFYLRATPNINASLGNVHTYAGGGLAFTFGPYEDRFQDTPPRVRPAMPGSGYFELPHDHLSWQIFAGIDARAVARNIFLDGNTVADSHSVDKKPFVGDATLGVSFAAPSFGVPTRISYSLNARSKEFDGQDSESVFGSVTLSARF